jgi:membrane protease YdiL (CAAX protease family)
MSSPTRESPGAVAAQGSQTPTAGGALSGRKFALALLAWIVLSACAAALTVLVADASMAPGTMTAIIVAEVYVLLVGSLLGACWPWPVAVEAFGLRLQWRDAVAGVVVGGLASGAAVLAYAVIGAWGPLADAFVWVGRDGGRLGSLPVVVTLICLVRATIGAAVAEELLFRGALFLWLRRRLGAWSTIVLTAALWAVAHGGVPVAIPYAFAVGLGLGWLRERRGSVMPGLIYHLLHNTVLFLAVYTAVGW